MEPVLSELRLGNLSKPRVKNQAGAERPERSNTIVTLSRRVGLPHNGIPSVFCGSARRLRLSPQCTRDTPPRPTATPPADGSIES